MENLPLFFRSLDSSRLINRAVTTGKLTDDDLIGYVYTRADKNKIVIKDFELGQKERFSEVNILMTNFGVMIDFITSNDKYFENAREYFNTRSVARAKPSYRYQGKTFEVKGIRLGRFSLFDKTVDGTVMRSELFGCKIMTSFH